MSERILRPRDLRYFGGVIVPSGGSWMFEDNTGFDFVQVLKTSGNLIATIDNGASYPLWSRSTLDVSGKQIVLTQNAGTAAIPAPAGSFICDVQIGRGKARDLPSVQDIIQGYSAPATVTCGATSLTQLTTQNKDV